MPQWSPGANPTCAVHARSWLSSNPPCHSVRHHCGVYALWPSSSIAIDLDHPTRWDLHGTRGFGTLDTPRGTASTRHAVAVLGGNRSSRRPQGASERVRERDRAVEVRPAFMSTNRYNAAIGATKYRVPNVGPNMLSKPTPGSVVANTAIPQPAAMQASNAYLETLCCRTNTIASATKRRIVMAHTHQAVARPGHTSSRFASPNAATPKTFFRSTSTIEPVSAAESFLALLERLEPKKYSNSMVIPAHATSTSALACRDRSRRARMTRAGRP